MTAAPSDLVCELLTQSLLAWRVCGEVRRADGGPIVVSGEGREILIKPAPPGLPFRWLVTVDDRERPAISVVAVVRQVRQALDPGYAMERVRVASFPLVPT